MARLAVAAILIFEATNKTSIPCGTSDFNETLASLIFMLVMKDIQKWPQKSKWPPQSNGPSEVKNILGG